MRKLKTLISAIAMTAPATCLAGPFCVVVSGLGADCKYYDQENCARAAVAHQGACVDRTTGVSPGFNQGSRYCLVRAGESQCFYYDAASCAKEAQLHGGTCLQRQRAGS